MRAKLCVFVSGLVCLLAVSPASAAKELGGLAGSVTSRDGARLPGVTLVVTSVTDGTTFRRSTGSLGTFRVPDLPVGAYELRASLTGFEDAVRKDIVVRAGEETQVVLALELATIRESVSVVGDAPRGGIEASELRERPAYDIGDALGGKPGLWRLRKGGIANEVVVRGLQSRDLNVLIDGQRVYGACPNHMDPAAFHVDFAEVDRVEVGMGPFDVKNQGGLGGTLNIETRKPGPGFAATPNLAVGSFGFVNPSLSLGHGSQQLSALAGYSYRRSDPYRDGDGRAFTELANYRPENRGDEAFSVATAWGRVVWSPAPGHQLDVAYTRQEADSVLYPYLMMDAIRDDTDRANVRYEKAPAGAASTGLRGQAYFTQVDHWMTDEARVSSVGKPRAWSMGTQADTRTAGAKLEAVRAGLSLGLEAYERRWDATNEMAGSGYAPQSMIPGVRVRVGGLFAEYVRPLGEGLELSAGARIDAARSEADAGRANVVLYEAYQGTRSLAASDTLPSGKLRLRWRRGGWDVGGGIGHAARPPEATERYLALKRMGSDWVGNPGLEPSRNTGLDATAGFSGARGFRVDLSLYRNRVADYVTVYDQARRGMMPGVMNTVARSFANVDATLQGGELGFSLPVLLGRVFVAGDVAYVRASQDGDAARGIVSGPLAETPPLRGRVSARFDDGRLFACAEGVFAGRQDRVDASLQETPTPGWGILNASAGLRRGRLRVTAGVANVFDRSYSEHLSYQRDPFRSGIRVTEPGRNLFANAAFSF